MLPRVTIITPSYNQAAFLEQTIQSVLDQGYPNLEYFVIDGASTDGSIDIIRKYAPHLNWWISEPDQGQADAINKGFAKASGEIVAWLNSDDYYLPGGIHAAVEALQANLEWGLVYGDVWAVDEANRPLNLLRYRNWTLDDLMCFNIIGQPAVFMRRSAWQQAGDLDGRFHYLLDHQLWLRIAMHVPICYVPHTWAAARYHARAKNFAQAAAFGRDAYEIVAWMRSQPGLAERLGKIGRKVNAGAHRINAYYLSLGEEPRLALQYYFRCFALDVPTALKDWKRFLLTVLSFFGIKWVEPLLRSWQKRRLPEQIRSE